MFSPNTEKNGPEENSVFGHFLRSGIHTFKSTHSSGYFYSASAIKKDCLKNNFHNMQGNFLAESNFWIERSIHREFPCRLMLIVTIVVIDITFGEISDQIS